LRRAGGVFAGLLKEQNRYNVEDPGRSIVASRFLNLAGDHAGVRQVSAPPLRVPAAPSHASPAGYHWPATGGNVPAPPMAPVEGNGQHEGHRRQAYRNVPPERRSALQHARVLIEVNGQLAGAWQLNKPLLTLGRLPGNDIQVPVNRISRLHAKIRWENGTWLIEDADSLNGLLYQGSRIEKHVLVNGDRIMLAPKVVLHFKGSAYPILNSERSAK
jgi:FHA domain